jgi:hypothetical protein
MLLMSMGEVLTGAIFQYHGKLINLKKGYLIRGKKGKDKKIGLRDAYQGV